MGGAISRISLISPISTLGIALTFFAWTALGDRAPAAEKVLSWWHDACEFTISYDPVRDDETRLRNTVHLLYGPPDFKAPAVGLPFNPQSVGRLSPEHTAQECRNALDVAGRLEFIPLPGIEEYRSALAAQIKDTCDFEMAEIRGFQDPSALRGYTPAAACSPFVDALEGKSDLMAAFRATVDRHCGTGAGSASAQCVERELGRSQKSGGRDWVRLYLMKFGWGSCADEFTSRATDAGKLARMRAGLEDQFQRAFKVKRNECDRTTDGGPEVASVVTASTDTPTRSFPMPAAPASPAAKAHHLRRYRPVARSYRAERAPCAHPHARRRTAFRNAELPTPFAADWSRQQLQYGRR